MVGDEGGQRLGVVEVEDATAGDFELHRRPAGEPVVAGKAQLRGRQGEAGTDLADPADRIGIARPGGTQPLLGDPTQLIEVRTRRECGHDVIFRHEPDLMIRWRSAHPARHGPTAWSGACDGEDGGAGKTQLARPR